MQRRTALTASALVLGIVSVVSLLGALIAIELSILSNCLINHLWTFGDRRTQNGDDGPTIAWFKDPAGNILAVLKTD